MTDLDPALPAGARTVPNEPDVEPVPLHAYPDAAPPPRSTPSRNGTKPAVETVTHRAPPHDLDAERAVLGAAMLAAAEKRPEARAALDALPTAAFWHTAHQHIADAIRDLHAADQPVDPLSVADKLSVAGRLEHVGGTQALASMMADAPVINPSRYVHILLRHHQARRLISVAAELDINARQRGPATALVTLRSQLEDLELVSNTDPDPELDEFLDQVDDDYDWLIPGLLERRDRVILTATEGTGKSTLLRQIAVQLASGVHPFTLDKQDPLRVLYIDCENSPRQARRALRGLRETASASYQAGHLRLRVLGNAMALGTPEIEADIAGRIRSQRADVVILGPLYKLITGDPIKEEPAKAVADAIDRLRNITGAAFLIEAHSPYPEGSNPKNRPIRPYGASLWSRWPEFGLHLADDGAIQHWRGQRDDREWPRRLTHATPWPWAVLDDPQDAPEWHGPTECADAIVALLEELGGSFSTRQIENQLRERGRGYRTKTVSEAALLAFKDDRIDRKTGARGSLLYSALDLSDQPLQETF